MTPTAGPPCARIGVCSEAAILAPPGPLLVSLMPAVLSLKWLP